MTVEAKKAREKDDPVYMDCDGKWYFWHEDWVHRSGPFESQNAAEIALAQYATEL